MVVSRYLLNPIPTKVLVILVLGLLFVFFIYCRENLNLFLLVDSISKSFCRKDIV